MDDVMLTHADDDPKRRRPGGFSLTPQGVLHLPTRRSAPNSRLRAPPGTRRTRTGIGVDTYRPLNVSPEFARMTQ